MCLRGEEACKAEQSFAERLQKIVLQELQFLFFTEKQRRENQERDKVNKMPEVRLLPEI